ncbi:hypothetical protein O1611_g1820 [Lasiodiplodia mahajangana]|uniref:Uncharacterized protein n=1 Tax=Lasiodiplodia mahajangana TaxID=1108764 RepID=A0ACC2JWN0_9PEZI|nr:hypothetical protein O1611_g1820 [Lasiodiplodia mahajangana]
MRMVVLESRAPPNTPSQRIPFNGMRALLDLAPPTGNFSVVDGIDTPIKLSDTVGKDPGSPQSSTFTRGLFPNPYFTASMRSRRARKRTYSVDQEVRLIINHFDVCPEVSRNDFLQFVRRDSTKNGITLKTFITSREPFALKAELSGWPSIDLATDINLPKEDETEQSVVIKGQKSSAVSQLPPMELPSTSTDSAKVDDVLALSILSEQQLKRNLSNQEVLLETTHGSLGSYTLEAVLDRVLRSLPDRNKTRLVVTFFLFTTRPLSSKEFAVILFLGSSADNGDSVLLTWDLFGRFERQRAIWFAGVTVNKHGWIHLAHTRLDDMLRTPPPSDQHYLWHEVASTAHYDIAYICLDYLARINVQGEQDLLKQPYISDADFGFISYAVQYWPYHFSLAQSTTEKETMKTLHQKMTEVDLECWSRTVWLLSNPFTRSRNPWESPFVALVSLGYPNILEPSCASDVTSGIGEAARVGNIQLVNSFLEAYDQYQFPPSVLVTIIMAASSSVNEFLAVELIDRLSIEERDKKLLEIGTPVDPEIPYIKGALMTPLYVASLRGHVPTVNILLSYGANVHFKGYLQQKSLLRAAKQGNADIVRCLVEQGQGSINLSTGMITPLGVACVWGRRHVVEKLIELGADTNEPDSSGWLLIFLSARYGQQQIIQILLDRGVDTESSNPKRDGTALLHALREGHVEVCRQLLERGANPSSPPFQSPLLIELIICHPALSEETTVTLAKLLLDFRVNINETNNMTRSSALSLAITNRRFKLAELLLEFNPDINIADRDGKTALLGATKAQAIPLVKTLLDRGADANKLTSAGEIPLHMCQGSPELTQLLVRHTRKTDLPTSQGATQLMIAASRGWTESVKILLEHKANVNAVATMKNQWPGWTPVMFAAYYHFADIVTILAEAGADLKKQDADGDGPLHLIFRSDAPAGTPEFDCLNALMEFQTRIDINQTNEVSQTVLQRCAEIGHLKAVQRLVRAGASFNHKDKFGFTALHEAVWKSQIEVVSYLLERGADPNIAGSDVTQADEPLLWACLCCDYSTAKILIDYGADVNCNPVSGYGTPLMAVLLPSSKNLGGHDELTQHLLELGADININSQYVGSPLAAAAWSSHPEIVRDLLNRGAVHDVEDSLKRKPIHFAAMNGEPNFRIIQEAGAELMETDVLGRSVLHYAAQGGRLQVIRRIFELSPGLDVDTRDIDGWTPLCWVARVSSRLIMEGRSSEPTDMIGVVRHLLGRGADPFVECRIGDEIWTPFRIFCHAGAPEEVTTLLRPRNEADQNTNTTTEATGDPSQQEGKLIEDSCHTSNEGSNTDGSSVSSNSVHSAENENGGSDGGDRDSRSDDGTDDDSDDNDDDVDDDENSD